MIELSQVTAPRLAPSVDEREARRALREQIAFLEGDLTALFAGAWPRQGFDWRAGGQGGGPRLLSLAELEQVRDRLAERVADLRAELSERARVEDENRRLIEEMMLEPERFRWVRVSAEDIGERGCKHWHVRPRFGLLGMLMSWWRVVISSGCP